MIKLFRNIRHRLFKSGSQQKPASPAGRYLVYAAGEIVLVVIGILIALQINNWNEDRKDFQKSHEILIELRENLSFNIQKAEEEIDAEYAVIRSVDIISRQFFEGKKYDDSLDIHFHNAIWWPSASWKISGYENLKSQGVELIRSKLLRSNIINLFEISYSELAEIIRSSENYAQAAAMMTQTKFSYQYKLAVGQPVNLGRAKPLNVRELQQSTDLYGYLSFWKLLRVESIRLRKNVIDYSENLIHEIDLELQK